MTSHDTPQHAPNTASWWFGVIQHMDRGFGFIRPDHGPYRVRFNGRCVIGRDFADLSKGDRIAFSAELRDGALHVRTVRWVPSDGSAYRLLSA